MDMVYLGYVYPTMDILQSVELLSADRTEDDRIIAVLQRDLNSCDFDDFPVVSNKQHIICVSGSLDSGGSITYHGCQTDSVQVNLMLNEELLFDRKFDTIHDVHQGVEISTGVVTHGDLANSSTPVAIDLTIPGIEIDPNKTTSYICRLSSY
jgi:hypothetical protein